MIFSKIKQKAWVKKGLPCGAVAAFFGLMAYQVLFPSVPTEAATTTAQLSATVNPVIELAVDTTALALSYDGQTSITPTAAGVTAEGTVNVYVSTNSPGGYTLKVYTNDTTTDMKHSNANVGTAITATAGGRSTLSANTWGFRVGSQNWKPVGASSSSSAGIVTENGTKKGLCTNLSVNYASCFSAGTADKTTVVFGANLTDSLPAGSYTNHVVFSAVGNPDPAAEG